MNRILSDPEAIREIELAVSNRTMDLRAWVNTPGGFVNEFDEAQARQRLESSQRALRQIARSKQTFPKVVCLCGSTKFWRDYQRIGLLETIAGNIVLSIGAASGTDDEHFGNLPREEYDDVKEMLDELHKRKIDLADEVIVLNIGGYIGSSTRSEIDYARALGKAVRYLEDPIHHAQKEI